MELEDKVKEATEDVTKMSASFEDMKKELELKMEEIAKAQAEMQKAMIRSNEEEKTVGTNYGFLQAKKEVALGKNALAPYWDDKTTKRFDEYLHLLYEKDYKGIEKAFGDNVQDNLSNWTPAEFRSELVRLAYVNSLALQKCRIVPMSRDKVTFPAPTGGYTVSWIDAGGAITDSKVTPGTVQLDTSKLGGIALINREDLDDPLYPVASFVVAQMGEDFGKKIDEEVFQGDDSDTANHEFDGWEYATSVEEVAGSTDATPTFAELLTEDNLLAMVGKLDDMERDGAEWYFTNAAWNAIRAIEDGSSSKIIRLNENYKYDLLGYPINLRSQVSPSATAERAAGFFGNMKYIYIGDRMDMKVDTSEHYRFANDQVVFRGLQRLAIKVALPSSLVRIVFGASA